MNDGWFNRLLKPGASAEIKDGIWRYHAQEEEDFFAEYLKPEFLRHLDTAEDVGWRQAVERGIQTLPRDSQKYTEDYFLKSYRSDFVENLRIGPGSTVLDLACGWGFASQRCLEKGANVVGTELARRRLAFCVTRFSQQEFFERFVGIELDVTRQFPFASAAFDAVIVSGLLEWVACSKVGDIETIQREFMVKVTNVLKTGGRLYLAIENRYWGQYFRGVGDLHTNQRLVSILPRRMARALSIMYNGKDYRAYCYSLTDYFRWFQSLGYQEVSVWYPEPDYVQPKKVKKLVESFPLQVAGNLTRRDVEARTSNWKNARFGRSFMFVVTK